jgi:hypothetical protein
MDPKDKYFVLAGAAIFERVTFFLSRALDELQTRYFPGVQPIEFHAAPMMAGEGFWRTIEKEQRRKILEDIAQIISTSNDPGLVLFGAAIEKSSSMWGESAVEHATEELCRRFDVFLKRRENEADDPQRGLLIFSEGRFHKRARVWVRGFRQLGTHWGILKNLSDIPYFASSQETRLLQVADYVSYAVFRLYERRDPSFIRPFLHRFSTQHGTLHGLVHTRSASMVSCDCPACASRRNPHSFGSWI